MEESFSLVAQSRANYYTPGSPVQFVRVELLRGDQSGENAVCLSFKNIREATLTGLKVHFKCKGTDGSILCEDEFDYQKLDAANGEVFGMDDAVFVTNDAIGSVDVSLVRAWYGRKSESLVEYQRVRLPAAKRLPKEVAAGLQAQSGRKGMKYMPQVLENGWYCACGAFHSKEEDTVYCSECGSDRILLQNAISGMLQPQQSAPANSTDEPTRVVARQKTAAAKTEDALESTRVVEKAEPKSAKAEAAVRQYEKAQRIYEEPEEEDEEDPRDAVAENIIRWVPAITALLCALIAMGGFLYCNIVL